MSKTSAILTCVGGGWLIAVGYLPLAARTDLVGRASRVPASAPEEARQVVAVHEVSRAPQSAQAVITAPPASSTLITRFCVSCHNPRLQTAGLSFDTLKVDDVSADPELWEKVVTKLRAGTMPPAGSRGPDASTRHAFVASVESELDRAAAAKPDPGRTLPLHRLNRAEYTNAIRDLLALEVDGRSLLPTDDSFHGFDSVASVLTVSPALLERYISAARRISRLAVGDPTIGPAVAARTYDLTAAGFQEDRKSDDLPFGSRGGAAIRHHFPLDGEYMVRIRLQRNYVDYVRGLGESHRLQVRLEGALLREFTIGGEEISGRAPISFGGNISGGDEWEAYALSADNDLVVRFMARAGTRTLGVAFVRQPGEPEGVLQSPQTGYAFAVDESRSSPVGLGGPAVHSVAVDGPYNAAGPGDTASRRRIFVCRPTDRSQEATCGRKIFDALARRAYRRPVTRGDVDELMGFFETGRAEGGFESGIERGIERLLVDPDFLFRIEQEPALVPPSGVYRISDLELASRLSFFLWSSLPDDELLDVAIRGTLRNPAVLERQVRRLLADFRSSALVDNFAAQWLSLRALAEVEPNPDLFPDFDDNLREAFQKETELFIGSQIREDRSIGDLLSANYTFLNERLARHYEITGVYGAHFRRVALTDQRRGGLLGQGSILTVTSYGNRTSPVLRGHWLLENVLGSPPPPPPPGVPGLADRGDDGKPRSVRERMEQHRKNPVCASCHLSMDPLGFALENFDAIGQWRTISEGGTPIDAEGSLPDGTRFQGVTGLRTHLIEQRRLFIATVTNKLLTYALGRGVEYYDRPSVRKILRDGELKDYRWSSLIMGVVKSTPFQMRRSDSNVRDKKGH